MTPQKKPLTRRQQDMLDFIREHIAEHGLSPSPELIGGKFDISLSNVNRYIGELVERGHLAKDSSTRPPLMTVL